MTEDEAQRIYEEVTEAIVDPSMTSYTNVWKGARTTYWNKGLEEATKRRNKAHRVWYKRGIIRAKEEARRIERVLKKMIMREKRRLKGGTRELLLTEPLGERAMEMKVDKRNRERWKNMCTRKGKQVSPASFKKHMVEAHEQWRYPPIQPLRFRPCPGSRKG